MPFWSFTVPQLSHTNSVVGAAAAALGAAIESQSNTTHHRMSPLLPWYVHALETIRNAIELNHSISTAVVTASFLLAITEILAGRELVALSHLQGALALLVQRQRERKICGPGHCDSTLFQRLVREEEEFSIDDEVDAAGAVLDISTATYALSLEPRLPALSSDTASPVLYGEVDTVALERTVLRALHSTCRFAAKYHPWRYVRHSSHPYELTMSQGLLAEQLFRHIEGLKTFVKTLEGAALFRARNLSTQCTSCFIYISRLFEPEETSFDRFTPHFEDIVTHAAALQENRNYLPTVPLEISLDLGCVQPLYFTAVKCRDTRIRRHAIQLLLMQTGREGPFDAKQHAAAACRAMELEERAAGVHTHGVGGLSAASIPEGVRLHGTGVDVVQSSQLPMGYISAAFSRCRDVEGMMSENNMESFKDPRWWDIWNETLPVPP